jgi:N-acetylneuraminate synthase
MGGEMWYELYGNKHLPVFNSVLQVDWLPKLRAEADKNGLEFMCTAFSPELLDTVDPFVSVHKIASAELTHVRLLESVAKTGKPVFLSIGASGTYDIAQSLAKLEGVPVVLLYCVAAYPAEEIDLGLIDKLRDALSSGLVGYSDHSRDVLVVPVEAARRGACVIEKHFTAIDADTPDRAHSLDVDRFRRMVDAIRGKRQGAIGATREERDMVLRHNRRLIATRDIVPGEVLREGENFGIFRSLKDDTKALSPWLIDRVIGQTAKNAIKAGDGIGPGDF